ATLRDFVDIPGIYAAGRLDRASQGLLLLTNDGRLQARTTHPTHKLAKTYSGQVEGEPTAQQPAQLRAGPLLNDGPTGPAEVEQMAEPALWPRQPPVRFRKSIPTSWLAIAIREGRNRQVRRMTAAVGLPTLRLVRVRIGDWELGDLQPGEWRELPCWARRRHPRSVAPAEAAEHEPHQPGRTDPPTRRSRDERRSLAV